MRPFIQDHVYIQYTPLPSTIPLPSLEIIIKKKKLQIALRDKEQCITPELNILAGNNGCGELLTVDQNQQSSSCTTMKHSPLRGRHLQTFEIYCFYFSGKHHCFEGHNPIVEK